MLTEEQMFSGKYDIPEEELYKQSFAELIAHLSVPPIYISDAICGSGKTSAAINMIRASTDEDEKFLYITPYLDEVNRVITSCPNKKFKQPQVLGTKLQGIKQLLRKGANIVSTHALFELFDEEIFNLIATQNYTLVMDEVAEVVKPLDITQDDLKFILQRVTIREDSLLVWDPSKYDGRFIDYKRLIDLQAVYYYSNTALVYTFPVTCFKAFHKIYILTYMFRAQIQCYYYSMFNLEYKYIGVDGDSVNNYKFNYTESTEPIKTPSHNLQSLIHIVDNEKMNLIGESTSALSKTWYSRNLDALPTLKNSLLNLFRKITKTPTSLNLWTTFKDYEKDLKGKGYAKGFIPCNARATNNFGNRISVAYMVNRYFNPIIKRFFEREGIEVLEDEYALSELIQFIFRSAIRNHKEITLYIPSARMRELLLGWLQTEP